MLGVGDYLPALSRESQSVEDFTDADSAEGEADLGHGMDLRFEEVALEHTCSEHIPARIRRKHESPGGALLFLIALIIELIASPFSGDMVLITAGLLLVALYLAGVGPRTWRRI